ncbi:MAG: F0F1 ATP synthase subunit B [Pseudomonadota bacterium]|nr:F0F1 ATP synthase subunit B [Pseudomonadota bacterium]
MPAAEAVTETVQETALEAHAAPVAAHGGGILSHAEVWLTVAFVIFVLGVFRPVRRAIVTFLDKHMARVRSELDEARQLCEDARRVLADIERKYQNAIGESETILAHAREQAAHIRSAAEAELDRHLKRREQQAMEKIALAEAAAIQDIRNRLVDLVMTASCQALSAKMSTADQSPQIERDLAEISRKLH